jgi:hypothetical protein
MSPTTPSRRRLLAAAVIAVGAIVLDAGAIGAIAVG